MKNYEVQWQQRKDPKWLPLVLVLYVPAALVYIIWRTTLINWHIWYGPLLYIAELYGFITTAIFLWMARKINDPIHKPVRRGATVDVLIPTYNEPLSVLEPVIIAATQIRGIGNVFVLDDGNRAEVLAATQELHVAYYPRTSNLHAKAGNMNNGLQYTTAEFLIFLDADHIPQPDFIEQTLGFFDDPKLGFVQSPQTFYNTGSFLFRTRHGQPAGWSEQTMFYDCIQPAKNRWNAAFFVGTSAIMRRVALDSVGGFATGTATEDIHTSIRLHAAGWKSVFLSRPLAYGLEAASFKEFYKQRKRWAAGSLGLLLRSKDSPLRTHGLSFKQRMSYLSATMAHLQGVQRLCFFIVPIMTLLWHVSPIRTGLAEYSLFFLGYFTITLFATSCYSRGTYHLFYNETYSLANMLAHFGGIKGVIKIQKKFAVSNKRASRQERTWLKTVLWGMLSFGVIAIGDDAWQYFDLHRHFALNIYGFIFISINCALLGSFLAFMHRYEHGVSNTSGTAAQPINESGYLITTQLDSASS